MTGSPGQGLMRLLEVFDRLEIPYMIGGSGASSVHGLARTTGNIDIVANLGEHVQALVGELQQDFYIDEGQIRAAVEYADHSMSSTCEAVSSSTSFLLQPIGSNRRSSDAAAMRRQRYLRVSRSILPSHHRKI